MVATLFRSEVVEARTERLHGAILMSQPAIYWALGLLLFSAVAGAGSWAALGTYARIERAPGIVTSVQPIAKVYALRPGLVTELRVREGDFVQAGGELASVQLAQPDTAGLIPEVVSLAAVREKARLGQLELDRERRTASTERQRLRSAIASYEHQSGQLGAQIVIQREIAASAKSTFEQLTSIVEKGFVSRLEYERRRQAWLTEEQRTQALEQQANSVELSANQARSDLSRLPLELAGRLAQVAANEQSLVQDRARLEAASGYRILAPIAGRVTTVQSGVGRIADPRVPVLSIVPLASKLEAELYVPSRAIGFVRRQQEVRLLYDAFPYQRFGSFSGTITSIARTVLAPKELDAPVELNEPVFRVRVSLARQSVDAFGEAIPLQPGMTLNANIVLERRSFLDWLLAPVRAVSHRA